MVRNCLGHRFLPPAPTSALWVLANSGTLYITSVPNTSMYRTFNLFKIQNDFFTKDFVTDLFNRVLQMKENILHKIESNFLFFKFGDTQRENFMKQWYSIIHVFHFIPYFILELFRYAVPSLNISKYQIKRFQPTSSLVFLLVFF